MNYEHFCQNGFCFYELEPTNLDQIVNELVVPSDWEVSSDLQWTFLTSKSDMDDHGWKVHISSDYFDSTTVIILVANICFEKNIPFKFCVNKKAYSNLLFKYADRASAGKLLTLYPAVNDFEKICSALEDVLAGTVGPEILTDLKISLKAPIYTRYGAFKDIRNDSDQLGYLVNGVFFEDIRQLFFTIPSQEVTTVIPDRVIESYNKREKNLIDPSSFPYENIIPLHFSNAGGVYHATDTRDSEQYILKEARKYVGIEGDHPWWNSEKRLINQYRVTKSLEQVKEIVPVLDIFTLEEHTFVKFPYIEAITLHDWRASNLTFHPESNVDLLNEQIFTIFTSLRTIVDKCHEKGWAIVDLHPSNILIDDELNLYLIDLEASTPINSPYTPTLGAVGYVPPFLKNMTWKNRDYYALLIIGLGLYTTNIRFTNLTNELISWSLEYIRKYYSKQYSELLSRIYEELVNAFPELPKKSFDIKSNVRLYNTNHDMRKCLSDLETSIHITGEIRKTYKHSTEPNYPGSIECFSKEGKYNIYNGIAGIGISVGRKNQYVNELCLSVILENFHEIVTLKNPSLLHGLTGIASYLIENTCFDEAFQLFEIIYENFSNQKSDIFLENGTNGFTLLLLCCLKLQGDSFDSKYLNWIDHSLKITSEHIFNSPQNVVGGLFQGYCGIALTYELASRIMNLNFTSEIQQCLTLETKNYMPTRERGIAYSDGEKLIPYLLDGCAGLGIAAYFIDKEKLPSNVLEILPKIYNTVSTLGCTKSGIFEGMAGLLLCKSYLQEILTGKHKYYSDIPVEIQPHLFTAKYHDVIILATPGEGDRRLSMDYGTGSAGMWAALDSIQNNTHSWLPIPKPNSVFER